MALYKTYDSKEITNDDKWCYGLKTTTTITSEKGQGQKWPCLRDTKVLYFCPFWERFQ